MLTLKVEVIDATERVAQSGRTYVALKLGVLGQDRCEALYSNIILDNPTGTYGVEAFMEATGMPLAATRTTSEMSTYALGQQGYVRVTPHEYNGRTYLRVEWLPRGGE